MISFFGGFVLEYPKVAATIYGAMKLTGFFMEKANWIANGLALAKGFNMGTSGRGGGGGGGLMDMLPGGKSMRVGGKAIKAGKYGKGLGMLGKGAGKAALPLAILDVGIDAIANATDDTLTTAEKFGKTLDQHKFMAAGAAIGSIFPVIGTAVGAGIGGLIDLFVGESFEWGEPANDGYFAGKGKSNFSKNRAIMQGGKITPIDNKDDLMALKKDGIVDKTMKNESINQPVKHEFGDIKITGELVLSTPGGERVSTEILKDPQLIRTLTRMIHVETEKVINGGKPK
jgi:hypothetical protein